MIQIRTSEALGSRGPRGGPDEAGPPGVGDALQAEEPSRARLRRGGSATRGRTGGAGGGARRGSPPVRGVEGRLRAGALIAAALSVVTCGSSKAVPLTAAESADLERSMIANLGQVYEPMLGRTGSTLVPGSPAWADSLHRTVTALLSGRPADCLPATWILGGCGRHIFDVPSRSMLPTILDRDTISTLPPTAGRPVRRGDIIAYRVSPDPVAYMHRVIGLPGEVIRVADGVIEIDGVPLEREPTGDRMLPGGDAEPMAVYTERLPDGRSYRVLWPDRALVGVHGAEMEPVTVPPGRYFVMGDDRALSLDSRPPDGRGMPKVDEIIGIAQTAVVSRDPERIGKPL